MIPRLLEMLSRLCFTTLAPHSPSNGATAPQRGHPGATDIARAFHDT